MKYLKKFADWFLTSRCGQWISMLFTGGWCFIDKHDPRFTVTSVVNFAGDPDAKPSRGVISTQRNKWRTWMAVQFQESCGGVYLAIDIHDGRRIAYLKASFFNRECACFRAGHESGWALGLVPKGNFKQPKLTIIGRWHADEAMPAELAGVKRTFV